MSSRRSTARRHSECGSPPCSACVANGSYSTIETAAFLVWVPATRRAGVKVHPQGLLRPRGVASGGFRSEREPPFSHVPAYLKRAAQLARQRGKKPTQRLPVRCDTGRSLRSISRVVLCSLLGGCRRTARAADASLPDPGRHLRDLGEHSVEQRILERGEPRPGRAESGRMALRVPHPRSRSAHPGRWGAAAQGRSGRLALHDRSLLQLRKISTSVFMAARRS